MQNCLWAVALPLYLRCSGGSHTYLILTYVVRSFGLDSVLPTNGSSLRDMRVASLITTAPDLLSTPLDYVLFHCLGSEFSVVL